MPQVESFTLAQVQTDPVSVVRQVQTDSEIPVVPQAQATSEVSAFRRAIEWWPYVFIIISVAGLAYIALSSSR